MLLTKEVELIPLGKMLKYYRDLGYDAKWKTPLKVKIEDLPKNSQKEIEAQCDICKGKKNITYKTYNNSLNNYGYYTCKKCSHIKQNETIKELYGVDNYFQTQECKDKMRTTFQKKYNCDNPMQNEEIKKRQQDSLEEHFGVRVPLQNEEIKHRAKNTTFEHYGYYYASQSDKFKKQVENTMLSKYNVRYPMQSLEIREKAVETLCKRGIIKTSSQQIYLHNIYGGELNYPIKYYSSDICFPDEKLCIEYDGKGHDLTVKLGEITQEEFTQKEIIRNAIIKHEGYNQMRIISFTDKLPSDKILLQMLEYTKQYFSNYPEHSWIEFLIDSSSVRNAENKDGIYYDYGQLRKIKKEEIKLDDCA